jgi:predicted nucleic acid-binding protein
MVAAVCSWHERHELTIEEMSRRRDAGDELIVAAFSLIETYSVLTRLPAPHRLKVADAFDLIDANWSSSITVTLSVAEHWRVLRDARDRGIHGGQVYDALIAACGQKGGAETLLTWNLKHFQSFQHLFTVTSPGEK